MGALPTRRPTPAYEPKARRRLVSYNHMAVSAARFAPLAFVLFAIASTGCMTKRQSVSMRTGGEAMPVVEVKPGYVERIALMDEYRLHDEMRKHMMARPRVWVEEVSDDELPASDAVEQNEANEQETSTSAAVSCPSEQSCSARP